MEQEVLQPVNFEVKNLAFDEDDKTFVNITVEFDNGDEFEYLRKYKTEFVDGNKKMYIIISGCKIVFVRDWPNSIKGLKCESITREYNVKGFKRKSTKNQSHSYKRPSGNQRPLSTLPPVPSAITTPDDIGSEYTDTNNPAVDDFFKQLIEQEKELSGDKQSEDEQEQIEPEKPKYVPPKNIKHKKYDTVETCLKADIPVYLAGPAGSGKNYTVEQIAKENGWNFYYTNSVQQEFKLTGFIDAGGDYQCTEFYRACTDEEECIFFLDEMDASIPEALVLINAAIANGYFEFPNGRVDLGLVHFVAAGNTVGSGADELYTGRMVLDQATLDRFAIIEWDYDYDVEMKITKGNEDLIMFVRNLRQKAETSGVRTTFSYRCLDMVTKLEKAKMDLMEILKIAVVKGLDKDTLKTLSVYGPTKYHDVFSDLQKQMTV